MKTLRILHLEDSPADAFFVGHALKEDGVDAEISVVRSPKVFLEAIAVQKPDLILLDNGVPGFSGAAALDAVRSLIPDVPVIIVSGTADEDRIRDRLKSGACDYVSKDHLGQLPAAVRRAVSGSHHKEAATVQEIIERGRGQT